MRQSVQMRGFAATAISELGGAAKCDGLVYSNIVPISFKKVKMITNIFKSNFVALAKHSGNIK